MKQEMDNISRSIIKLLVEDRITDDQFEKLLKRRDDLIEKNTNMKQTAAFPWKTDKPFILSIEWRARLDQCIRLLEP
jgi:hypothetical protein